MFDEKSALLAFAAFCRIGACLSIAPGFSSPRIPMRIRLFIAFGVAASFSLSLEAPAYAPDPTKPAALLRIIASETLVGALLGLNSRMVLGALETLSVAISMAIGLTSSFGGRVDENESLPELASLLSFGAIALIFFTDLHLMLVQALWRSFDALPLGASLDSAFGLSQLLRTLEFGFRLSLRIAMPFLAFGMISNIAFAAVNRMVSNIPLYFVSTPFVLGGGLLLLILGLKQLFAIFIGGFRLWIVGG
ncbi:MAG: flagellar biosynthetic protein FliR [Hyphomicrobiales bacterium]|nr:flagellar biosynthetic protein FliR [Hyphomicrobiales bacterium]